ncbi:SDR family NAD(P)-dependent oxidoreductase [Pseudomaricurvus alkylphenolicus]|uniref:SDR family NAD(P)-dependent oxidoreductase n=1 Tax=Pseudomaricurvus alkylphenolicus TaxID=1306991 RepID=UPI0014201415|nr:SDR family NAD(P)-dependent oxidoreductase [Pseudomaricurvus alkylphenolicus]NIB38936.1 SDR family NAD(P)-dependent oxidoreductase [Pseudomaricurvus alkylphenolicus]
MKVLEGKAAVVTGAGRGVGRAHCLQLANAGAAVVVNDVDGAEAEKVVTEIVERGGRAVANTDDISRLDGATGLVSCCVDSFGAIDIMLANAGVVRDRTFLKMSEEELGLVIDVHLKGTFFCLQQAALRMKEQGQGGSLITTVSAAHFGNFGQANYAAAKGGIASLTYTLALELARYGIRVNGISPLATTRMSDTFKGEDGKEVEMPFFDPELNGPMVIYLCSVQGNYISGQIFGTGGERITLLSQPSYGNGIYMPGGWSLEKIDQHFRSHLGQQLEPIGLMKTPYPFYKGILAPEK